MRFLISILILVTVTSGCDVLSDGPSGDVATTMTEEDFNFYYLEMDKRMNRWFCGEGHRVPGKECDSMPNIYDVEYLRSKIYFIETGNPNDTCYNSFDSSRNKYKVMVPTGKWNSGCVPHEFGHVMLHEVNHRCASIFEHDPNRYDAPEKCK